MLQGGFFFFIRKAPVLFNIKKEELSIGDVLFPDRVVRIEPKGDKNIPEDKRTLYGFDIEGENYLEEFEYDYNTVLRAAKMIFDNQLYAYQ